MSDVLIEVEDAIGIVTVNRPDKLNSLSSKVRRDLAEAFEKFDNDGSIDVCIPVSYTHLTLPTTPYV